jgi:hypothetical protein
MNAPFSPDKMKPNLSAMARSVTTRDELVQFIRAMHLESEADPECWDNNRLTIFLEALSAWTDDMDGYFKNTGQSAPDGPSWGLFAQMLMAATVYE